MRLLALVGVSPLKALSVSPVQTGSQIHVFERLFGIDKLIDGLMADGVPGDIMGDSAGDLLRA
jgi:hypothetical protein